MLPSEVFFNNFLDSMDNDKKMQCDIYEKDNNINIEMDIPGFNKEDINIEINKGNLVVTAEKNEDENEDKKYLRRERKFYGKYQRGPGPSGKIFGGMTTAKASLFLLMSGLKSPLFSQSA